MNNTKKHAAIHITLLLLTLIIAALLRVSTFWTSHTSADEFQNLSLAIKLDNSGLSGYNLKGVDYEDFSLDGKTTLRELIIADTNDQGMVLEKIQQKGILINDNLSTTTPGLPYFLMLSQKTIGKNNGYFISSAKLGRQVKYFKPDSLVYAQFYAVIIPFVFSLILVLLTYLLSLRLFGRNTGLIAAFLMATNPVSIFVSQKIWPDEIGAVFLLLAVILFIWGYNYKSLVLGLSSGLLLGIAALFAPATAFLFIGFLLFHYWENKNKFTSIASVFNIILNPFMLLLLFGLIVPITLWHFAIAHNFSYLQIFSYLVLNEGVVPVFLSNQRPAGFFILLFGIPYLSPLLILSWMSFSKKLHSTVDYQKRWVFPFLFFWIFTPIVLILVFTDSIEHRLAISAYPAIALLSANVINYLRLWGKKYTQNWKWIGADEIVIIVLIISARWSVFLINELIYNGSILILKPF